MYKFGKMIPSVALAITIASAVTSAFANKEVKSICGTDAENESLIEFYTELLHDPDFPDEVKKAAQERLKDQKACPKEQE